MRMLLMFAAVPPRSAVVRARSAVKLPRLVTSKARTRSAWFGDTVTGVVIAVTVRLTRWSTVKLSVASTAFWALPLTL